MTTINIQDIKFEYAPNHYQKGEKRIVTRRTIIGNSAYFTVSYYDEAYDRLTRTRFGCCQPPTKAKTEKGALKMIAKFFNS